MAGYIASGLVKRKRTVPVVESLPPKSSPKVAPLLLPVTATDAFAAAEPPAPVQVRVNVLLGAVSAPVLAEPEVARLPLQAPLALQLVASLDDQVRFELPPLVTEVGLALSETVGAGVVGVDVTVTVAD